MKAKKAELLAPAGNYQALIGAINAGADAVYLGGNKFSARAYADNFTEEELLKALCYTHICGKKLYLTLNTLIKEKEFSQLYDYVRPLYEAGLDGIIVQDLGVWSYLREVFPGLPLHASTQMTITSAMGALLLKQAGASRIVPARELSLEEIKDIKAKSGLEIECFIHGAMCYCYSGQCLFSSILGGRSGNRGRCAQPCRLPYKVSETDSASSKELYPLSLKDMCTIEYIPKLIEAGIDSFKIEGRMKKPEYTAGVTAVYRKYIDRYYNTSYQVDKADLDRLYRLYIRSEVQSGYYERYNGREMITIGRGSYLGSDEALLKEISEQYLKEEKKIPVKISGSFKAGEAAALTIEGLDNGITHTSYGEIVQPALKRPMTKEEVLKQLTKTGNSYVDIAGENITAGDNIFVPIASINELRRNAVTAFEDKIIEAGGLAYKSRALQPGLAYKSRAAARTGMQTALTLDKNMTPKLHVSVQTLQQLSTACKYPCDRLYIDSDLYIREVDRISQYIKRLFEGSSEKYSEGHLEDSSDMEIYLALPFIIRKKDAVYLEQLESLLNQNMNSFNIKGFLVRNLEALNWIIRLNNKYDIVTDYGIYCFNTAAVSFLQEKGVNECNVPWELNGRECSGLIENLTASGIAEDIKISMPVYGTIPMMITANCVRKTADSCGRSDTPGIMYLIDRYNKKFPVLCNCEHCYNVIYNSVPYSLHTELKSIQKLSLYAVRLDFIFESDKQMCEILDFYTQKSDNIPLGEYTLGHYKRGVE